MKWAGMGRNAEKKAVEFERSSLIFYLSGTAQFVDPGNPPPPNAGRFVARQLSGQLSSVVNFEVPDACAVDQGRPVSSPATPSSSTSTPAGGPIYCSEGFLPGNTHNTFPPKGFGVSAPQGRPEFLTRLVKQHRSKRF